MKHLRSFFAVLLAAAICAAVVLFSGCGASVQVQQLTIPGERGSIHATLAGDGKLLHLNGCPTAGKQHHRRADGCGQ